MKKIPILQYTLRADENATKPATTVELLRLVLAQPPAPSQQNPTGGFDFLTIRARNRVADTLDKLTADAKEIKFEDADYATAVQCVRDYRGWRTTHKDVEKFATQFGL